MQYTTKKREYAYAKRTKKNEGTFHGEISWGVQFDIDFCCLMKKKETQL